MNPQELLVGGLAILIGAVAIVAAATNWDDSFRLRLARVVDRRFGRGAARAFYALIGLTLIALGVAIAVGYTR